MLPHFETEVAHPLPSAKFTPFLLRDEERNVRIYLFSCLDSDIYTFSEICFYCIVCHLGTWQ
jgi:uncharacterized membrane protein YebE (DUF533 family)